MLGRESKLVCFLAGSYSQNTLPRYTMRCWWYCCFVSGYFWHLQWSTKGV